MQAVTSNYKVNLRYISRRRNNENLHNTCRKRQRDMLWGFQSGGFENKDIYVAEQFLKCLRKTQVRLSKSDLGLPWAVAAVLT